MQRLKSLSVTIFFLLSTISLFGDFILKDEIGINKEFHEEVEKLGEELFQKSGISAYMLILKTTNSRSLSLVGLEELEKLGENSFILTFAEVEQKVDIVATEQVLKLFDKEQVLSPYPWSGTILPILGEKIKQDVRHKYSVALFNGYADIVEQIANNKDITLANSVGSSNKYVLNILRVIFYSILFIALSYLFYRKFIKKGANV